MTNLQAGKYITRSGRQAILDNDSTIEDRKHPDGATTQVRIWNGRILTQAGQVESTARWEETLMPRTIAQFVTSPRMDGVPNQHDLVQGPLA